MDDVEGWEAAYEVDEEHDQVGTVEVQILLSWFFETADPAEIAFEMPEGSRMAA